MTRKIIEFMEVKKKGGMTGSLALILLITIE